MVNAEMVKHLLNSKLDEMLQGSYPDGFKLKERTPDRLDLIAEGGDLFGIRCHFLKIAFSYKDVEITISHE